MRNEILNDKLTTEEVQQVVRNVVEEMKQHNEGVLNGLQDLNPLGIPFILERSDVYDEWLLHGFANGSYSLTEVEDVLYTKRLQELFRMFTREELETNILDYSEQLGMTYISGTLHDFLEGEIQLVTSISHPVIDTHLDTLHPRN